MPRKIINDFLLFLKDESKTFDLKLLPNYENFHSFGNCPFFFACQLNFLLCLDHVFRFFDTFISTSDLSEEDRIILKNKFDLSNDDVLKFLLGLDPKLGKRFILSVLNYPYL